ncbi:MAG TPA: glycosyl transferase family 2, partial [Gemmatimonadetes bacterium]|nr:glycosyl transferase family 2 [Gemmatimonadota bacterium]
MPVRNGVKHLDEAMRSLVTQIFDDFEVIVVDDGSTDGTWDHLERWASDDQRIRLFRSRPRGIVDALEIARAQARARYLARMDADDIADRRRFALQWALLMDEPTVGLDPGSRELLVDYVHQLCRDRGMGVLWATHLVDEAERAHRVIVLHKG